VIRRFPITNAEFVEFLNQLVADGRVDEALQYCPRLSAGTSLENEPRLAYSRDIQTGRFVLPNPVADATSPAVQIDWYAAMAFAKELSQRTGLLWRLPSELEWEKAARGVDGRYMPWGDQLEPTWACVAGSRSEAPRVMPVSAYPTDVSPYGVRGMAGNVKDWCIDRWHIDGPRIDEGILQIDPEWPSGSTQRLIRGSAWISVAETMRLASRYAEEPTKRHGALGFRLVRPYRPAT
jgi:serine/threonine-protein kinase